MTRLDGARGSIAIAFADITYAFGMRARTSRLPCSYQLPAREPTLNAFILEVAAAEATGWQRQRIGIGARCSGILVHRAIVLRTGDR
ncbi:hypothetical protein [Microcoleus sp. herbarium14]|uniref:hypothetical protein n=1 Tax=Microcoleus sp. herbarium14 TaxID=3055439 RepID=UPI002FD612EA